MQAPQISSATDVPLVLADRIQLQQVILNLILNAMEAMSDSPPRGGSSAISESQKPSCSQLVIREMQVKGVPAALLTKTLGS
jgi:phosphoglycerate-specific signal transduction histidine kinase